MIEGYAINMLVYGHDVGRPEYANILEIYVFECTFWNIVQIHFDKVSLVIQVIVKIF